jgi:putative transposase
MLFVLWLTVRLLTSLLVLPCAHDGSKDLEILVLRHQLRVLRRKSGRPKFTACDRVLLAAASRLLPRARWVSSFLVTPQTLLRWHRRLVQRKWTYAKARTPGRPPIDPQIAALIVRMARENARWGCVRICGELRKLGIRVGATTIRTLLRRHGLGPAPRRSGPTWTQFLGAQAEGIVACDLFTVETIRLKTLHVLFFIQLSTRRVVAAGVTAHPDTAWVTQQARNATMDLDDRGVSIRFLLRDHDTKFTRGFDEVFRSEGAQVLRTPIRAPKANAHAERWVQTVRRECLDWTLVLGRRHLLRLLRGYVRHYNQQRPHRSLGLAVPEARERRSPQVNPPAVRCRDVLGGLIHEYHEAAA